LCGIFAISYLAVLPSVIKCPQYFAHWMKWILFLPSGQILFPFPSLILFALPTWLPIVVCLPCYKRIWRIHVGIVGLLQN
jgi:hypothetical protein